MALGLVASLSCEVDGLVCLVGGGGPFLRRDVDSGAFAAAALGLGRARAIRGGVCGEGGLEFTFGRLLVLQSALGLIQQSPRLFDTVKVRAHRTARVPSADAPIE